MFGNLAWVDETIVRMNTDHSSGDIESSQEGGPEHKQIPDYFIQ